MNRQEFAAWAATLEEYYGKRAQACQRLSL